MNMETIEERAREWVDSPEAAAHPYNRRGMIDAYIAGAKAQYEELTRWHDPKDDLPEYVEVVEVKYKAFGKIMMAVAWRLGCLDSCEDAWYIDGTNRRIDPEAIIGWREIHE